MTMIASNTNILPEPAFVTTLRAFAQEVNAKAKELNLDGEIRYEIADKSENRKVLVIWFVGSEDTDDIAAKFEVSLGKRYHGENVIKVYDIDEDVRVFMQGDPVALLAYMTF